MRIEMYQDRTTAWRWRAVDTDGRVICDGAESYVQRSGLEATVDDVVNGFRGAIAVVFRERRSKPRPNADGTEPTLYETITVAEYQAQGELTEPHS